MFFSEIPKIIKKIKKLNTYSNIIITNHIGGLTHEFIKKQIILFLMFFLK